jgi:hypothetical protein
MAPATAAANEDGGGRSLSRYQASLAGFDLSERLLGGREIGPIGDNSP